LDFFQIAKREKNQPQPNQYQDNKQYWQKFSLFVEQRRLNTVDQEREERKAEEQVENQKKVFFLIREFCRKRQGVEGDSRDDFI
jgi:hypothetical protein